MLIVKVMHGETEAPGSNGPHSLYGDISSVHFPDTPGQPLRLHQRETVKTAMVDGFVESERFVDFSGSVYVLSENGRTVSSFRWPSTVFPPENSVNIAIAEGGQIVFTPEVAA